jgi:hypothetical protein
MGRKFGSSLQLPWLLELRPWVAALQKSVVTERRKAWAERIWLPALNKNGRAWETGRAQEAAKEKKDNVSGPANPNNALYHSGISPL